MSEKHKFSFNDYKLLKIIFNLNDSFPNENTDNEGIEVNPTFQIDYKKDEKWIFVNLNIKYDNQNAPFHFDIGIVGVFEFDIDISNENMESVVNINCAALLFPFLREIIADITRRAGFPALILPPVNFVRLYKDRVEIKDSSSNEISDKL